MKEWFYKVSVVILGMGVVSCSSSKESVSSVSSPSVESNSSPHFVIASSGGPHTATGSSYDVNGNPAFESSSGLETRYKYDTNLRLIEQEVRPQGQSTPGTKFRSVYNAEGVKIASFLPDGTIDTFHPSTRMRKKPGSVLAMISYEGGEIDETTPSRFNKLIKDHLGSVVAVANTLGFEEVKDVLPYGQDFYRSTTPHTSYGFNGNKEEGISSLNKPLLDYNARYYAPGRGRFTGVDTVVPDPGSVRGYNRYTYTSNNPANRIDPTGHADSPWNVLDFLMDNSSSAKSSEMSGVFLASNHTYFRSMGGAMQTGAVDLRWTSVKVMETVAGNPQALGIYMPGTGPAGQGLIAFREDVFVPLSRRHFLAAAHEIGHHFDDCRDYALKNEMTVFDTEVRSAARERLFLRWLGIEYAGSSIGQEVRQFYPSQKLTRSMASLREDQSLAIRTSRWFQSVISKRGITPYAAELLESGGSVSKALPEIAALGKTAMVGGMTIFSVLSVSSSVRAGELGNAVAEVGSMANPLIGAVRGMWNLIPSGFDIMGPGTSWSDTYGSSAPPVTSESYHRVQDLYR